MVVPTTGNLRRKKLNSDSSVSFKKIAPKVDCRWQGGAPTTRKNTNRTEINKTRRKTEHGYIPQLVASIYSDNDAANSSDDVFDGSLDAQSSTPFKPSIASESVSDHYGRLFHQLDQYMATAPEFDCIFIRRRVQNMKDEMYAINEMFTDLLRTGERLEKFLIDRQNNSNVSKASA